MTIFIIFLLLSVGYAQDPTTPLPCLDIGDACDMGDTPNILKITCADSPLRSMDGEENCNCVPSPDNTNSCAEAGADNLDGSALDEKDMCHDFCKKQSEDGQSNTCLFWKWKKTRAEGTTCSLSSTCETVDPCGDLQDCYGGQLGCEKYMTFPTTQNPTEAPLNGSCNGQVAYDSSKVHWSCIAGMTEINIYKEEFIPADAECHTTTSCPAWNEGSGSVFPNKLIVKCQGGDGEGSGIWVPAAATGSQSVTEKMCTEDGAHLAEPDLAVDCGTYHCPPLELVEEELTKPGVTVFCETPLEDVDPAWTITETNSCILLCDGHLTKSIVCVQQEDGSKAWMDEVADVEITEGAYFQC